MSEITTELNGIKYLLIEVLVMDTSGAAKLERKIKRHECIEQGVKDVKAAGFWSNAHMVAKILVPEKNIIAFNNED